MPPPLVCLFANQGLSCLCKRGTQHLAAVEGTLPEAACVHVRVPVGAMQLAVLAVAVLFTTDPPAAAVEEQCHACVHPNG